MRVTGVPRCARGAAGGAHARAVTARRLIRLLERPLIVGEAIDDRATPVEGRDAIVVLGAPLTPGGIPSPILEERLAVAAALWHRAGAPIVVVTGGKTRGARRTEAAGMAEALHELGVPEAAIVVEDQSRTTAENARGVRARLPDARRIWVVTQPFHTRRAARLFRREGFEPRLAYRAGGIEARQPHRALRWVTREYAAWVVALIRR